MGMDVEIQMKDGTKKLFGSIDWVGREHGFLVLRVTSDKRYKTFYPIEDIEEVVTSE